MANIELKKNGLIDLTCHFLSLHDIVMSENSVVDISEVGRENFDVKHLVKFLGTVGFSASLGKFKAKKLTKSMCPFIAFDMAGQAHIVCEITRDGEWVLGQVGHDTAGDVWPASKQKSIYSGYVILAKKSISQDEKNNRRWFFHAFKASRSLYVNVAFGTMFSNILALFSAFFMMVVYDRVIPNSAMESLIVITIGVLLALGFEYVINVLNSSFTDKASMRADSRVARAIFERLLEIRIGQKDNSIGRLSGIVREFDNLREFFTSATLMAVVNLPFVFLFLWVIYLVCGPLAFVPLASAVAVILVGVTVQPVLNRYSNVTMESDFTKQGVLIELLTGLETVKATGSGSLLKRRFEEATDLQSRAGLQTRFSTQIAVNLANTIIKCNMIGTVVYGVFLIEAGTVTMGSLFAAVLLGSRALAPLNSLTAAMSRAAGARQAYMVISKLFKDSSFHTTKLSAPLSRPKMRGEIELKDVTFQFDNTSAPAVSNLSIKIPAGQKIAILGGMGSGKSTLIKLLSGVISPTSGSILFDGVDARQISDHDLRRHVGTMLQNTWLFSGTIRDNIRMGFYEYSDEQILRAAKISTADDFISKTAMGYDLELSENGNGLSGGQRQTINLARSLLHDPKILILDEPTSAVDKTSEKKIIKNLDEWSNGKTVFFVTHREAMISLADRVLIMKDGEFLADTTPEGLRPASLKKV